MTLIAPLLGVALAGAPVDVSAWCTALQERTLQVRGVLTAFRGDAEPERSGEQRWGTGFWIRESGVAVTAEHVVKPLSEIEVCDGAGACHPVTGVYTFPDWDVAVLRTDHAPRRRSQLRLGRAKAAGVPVVAAGYPGDVGFVCGPGHVTGTGDPAAPTAFFFWEGSVAAGGSSGGPVVAHRGRRPRHLTAIGAISGSATVEGVRFNRGAPLTMVTGREATVAPRLWRDQQPWKDDRTEVVTVYPGAPVWQVLDYDGVTDVRVGIDGAPGGVCVGVYETANALNELIAAGTEVATSCDRAAVTVTTVGGPVQLAVWTESAGPWEGRLRLQVR